VILAGRQAGVEELLRGADLFVLPSRREGLPMAILEAMASGVPIVATRVGGVPEIIEDGEDGVLVPPEDPGALAAALGGLLDHPDRRAAMGIAARRKAEREFSLADAVDRYSEIYREIARKGAPC